VHPRAQQLIATLGLEPHPEGGWYRQMFRSEERVTRHHDGAERRAITTIYFLLAEGTVSRPHVVQSDEVWHFYEGGPLELTIGDERVTLDADHRVHVVPARVWQSARPLGAYAFVGCTVGPGFEFEDFEMAPA
jgi:predicted cupin superfamily sugar epimerase